MHQEKIQVSPLGDSQCWLPPDPPDPPDLQEGSKHSAPTLQGGSNVVTCPQGGQGGQGGVTTSLPQEGNAYFFLMLPCMAHVIQLFLGAFMKELRIKIKDEKMPAGFKDTYINKVMGLEK